MSVSFVVSIQTNKRKKQNQKQTPKSGAPLSLHLGTSTLVKFDSSTDLHIIDHLRVVNNTLTTKEEREEKVIKILPEDLRGHLKVYPKCEGCLRN